MISYLLVASRGVDAVRGLFTIVGLPMAFMIIFYVICLIKEGWRLSKMKDGMDLREDEAVTEELRLAKEQERKEIMESAAAN